INRLRARPRRMRLVLLLVACATTEMEDTRCCAEQKAVESDAPVDFAAQVEGPARCARAASSSEDPWRHLWECVQAGRFTAVREQVTAPRWVNLDVPTGQRVLAVIDGDPFLDAGDPVVLLARFDGVRDGDGWPELSVLGHIKPAATLAY